MTAQGAESEHDEIRQFLVMRDANGRLRSILVFDQGDEDKAHEAYCAAEQRGVECCLFGTSDVAALARTHPNWLDIPFEPWPEVDPAALQPKDFGF